MTCIVGIAHEGSVILGADSAGVSGFDRRVRKDRKVFTNGALIFGFTETEPMARLQAGLVAAAAYSAGVVGPFHFVTLDPDRKAPEAGE